jgi:hypothetical protein
MADPKSTKPPRWPADPLAASSRPASSTQQPQQSEARAPRESQDERGAGRIVHDARGNAVWDWLKETSRAAIESTSAMLKRLEVPGLKVEGQTDEELRIESDRDEGGGYDPYNQRTPAPKSKPPGRK